MSPRVLLAVFALAGSLAACSDTAVTVHPDASVSPRATPGICIPGPGGTGNELHVGAYCKNGGDQCAVLSTEAILVCAADVDPAGDEFCIKIGCSSHALCGEQGCCTGREGEGAHACVPKGCLTEGDLTKPCPPIPGLVNDAGTSTRTDGG